jgi:hypothetical protein
MHHLLIKGPSYQGLDFEQREEIREAMREELAAHGIRFVEYPWVWDEDDCCLLLVGSYDRPEDGRWWTAALRAAGFEIVVRTALPGDPPSLSEIVRESGRSGRPA